MDNENNLNIKLANEERSYADRLKKSTGKIYGKIKKVENEFTTILKGYAELGVCSMPVLGTFRVMKRQKDALKKLGEDYSWREILLSKEGVGNVAVTTGLQIGGAGGAYASQFLPAPWNTVGLVSSIASYVVGSATNMGANDEGRSLEKLQK